MKVWKRALSSAMVIASGVWFLFDAWVAANFGACMSSGGEEPYLTCLSASPVASAVTALGILIAFAGVATLLLFNIQRLEAVLGWAAVFLALASYALLLYSALVAGFVPSLQSEVAWPLFFLPAGLLGVVGGLFSVRWKEPSSLEPVS